MPDDPSGKGVAPVSATRPAQARALLRAAHLAPTAAVTALTALLALAERLAAPTAVLVTAAVLSGQLVIGWSNDLLDAGRDRQVARPDKPLATGELSDRTVLAALAVGAVSCLGLSLSLGLRAGLLHVVVLVGSGLAYNVGVKATAWSWLPYATAFGSLPAVVTLSAAVPRLPAWWVVAAAAALGVAAHFLNVLPDLADDAATDVHGLPHRWGAAGSRIAATSLLVAASVAAALGPRGAPPIAAWPALAIVAGLAVVALNGRGVWPFRAAIGIALVDVALLAVVR